MVEICPKTKSYPPLIKQKLISTPPSHNDNIKANPPPPPLEKSLLPLIPSYLVYLLDFFLRESFKESSESLDSELVSSLHKLGDSSSSTASLALRFPRVWVRTRSINSYLKTFSLQIHFQQLVGNPFYIFFSCSRLSGVFLSLTLFWLASRNCELKVLRITFTCSLVHVVLGTYLVLTPFFRRGQFSLVEQFLYLDTWEKLVDLVSSGRCRSEW